MLAGCRCAIVARMHSLRAGILLCVQRAEANHTSHGMHLRMHRFCHDIATYSPR